MDFNSFLASHLHAHYKKLLLLCTISATVYLIKKYLDKKRRSKMKKEKKKIKDFPTIEEIQKFIEDLPFDAINSGKSVTLKDLLGELSEFSEDEDWKELIASVHNMYQENGGTDKRQLEQIDETGSIISIYEDPNVLTLNGKTPRNDNFVEKSLREKLWEAQANENRGNGDANTEEGSTINEKADYIDAISANLGEGDTNESVQI